MCHEACKGASVINFGAGWRRFGCENICHKALGLVSGTRAYCAKRRYGERLSRAADCAGVRATWLTVGALLKGLGGGEAEEELTVVLVGGVADHLVLGPSVNVAEAALQDVGVL